MTELSTFQLITLVLSSSFMGAILAAVINGVVNWRIPTRNFKYKSREEIIKRRFQAYDKLAAASLQFRLFIHEPDGNVIPFVFSNGIAYLEEFQVTLMKAFIDSFWMDDATSNLFTELNVYLHNIYNEASAYTSPDEALKKLAVKDKVVVKRLVERLSAQLKEDLLNIHEVERFIHRKVPKQETYPVVQWSPRSSPTPGSEES